MIIPTILETNIDEIEKNIKLVESFAPLIQIDIADGKLENGKTFLDLERILQIKTTSKFELDLMIEDPAEYLSKINAGDSKVIKACANVKAGKNIAHFIEVAKSKSLKTGITINYDSTLSDYKDYFDKIDFVQFLSVVAGGQGRDFEPTIIEKIKEFRASYPHKEIQIDGSVNEATIPLIENLGIDNFVVGSAIMTSEYPKETYNMLEAMLK